MGNRLRRLLKSKSDAQVSFKLSPGKNAEVEVRDNGIFRMTWKSAGKPQHRWYSEGGKSGSVDAKYISHGKRWKDAFEDKGVGQKYLYGEGFAESEKNHDNKVIGLMSSADGHNLFLYEQERIRFNEDKGKVAFRGKLLSSQFVVENAEELAFAFGSKVVRNHLLMERGWRDGKKASLENFSAMMSANVSDDFWNDISKINHKISKLKNTRQSSVQFDSASNDESIIYARKKKKWNPFKDAKKGINDAAKIIDSAVDNAAAWAEANVIDPVSDDVFDASEYIEDMIEKVDDFIIKPAEEFMDDAIDFAEDGVEFIVDELTGKTKLSSTVDLPVISAQRNFPPFHGNFSASASVTTEIIFNEGYVGAVDPSTISIQIKPNIDINAKASIELDPLITSYDFSIEANTSRISNDPTMGQVVLSGRLDMHFESSALAGDGVGAGVSVEVSPEATLNIDLDNSAPRLTNVNHNFIFTEDFDRLFNSFEPKGNLSASVTPVAILSIGPRVPEKVSGIGGMILATVDIAYMNPILFNYDTTDPTVLNGSSSGVLQPTVKVLGEDMPGIPSVDLYEEDFSLQIV